jgi:RecG-like helicase
VIIGVGGKSRGSHLSIELQTDDGIVAFAILNPTGLHRDHLATGASIRISGRYTAIHGERSLLHPRVTVWGKEPGSL